MTPPGAGGPIRGVIFDLGGVVFPSPIDAMREHESEVGLPYRFLSETILATGDDGAWSRMERGELTVEEFVPAFEAECAARGARVEAAAMMARIGGALEPRPEMLAAIEVIRDRGRAVAALTNNWVEDGADGVHPLRDRFDVVVESARVGMRKPDRRIYELACRELALAPPEVAFLDDLGANLKPARALGMTTIKVIDPAAALDELGEALGFSLPR